MPWNPEVYNQFKSVRYQPFFDLMEFVSAVGVRTGVDIGCGTGALIPYIEDCLKENKLFLLESLEQGLISPLNGFRLCMLLKECCCMEEWSPDYRLKPEITPASNPRPKGRGNYKSSLIVYQLNCLSLKAAN